MSSSCRLALMLAFALAAATAVSAQSSSSSSSSADQAQPVQNAAQSAGALSVQARIKARRAARRAAAIHEVYSHRYEAYTGMGLQRFEPGPGPCSSSNPCTGSFPHGMLEHAWEYAWNVGVTRYQSERLGWNLDDRGYYGTAYVGGPYSPDNNAITNAAISQYALMAGPTYRVYLQPKFSISVRGLAGFEKGNFSGDTNHSTALATQLGLWDNGYTFAASPAIPVEYNVSPKIGLRVAPEYYFTGFGSNLQHSRAFTVSLVYRFGKQ
jgi:opacity protein-like surface antigen